MRTADTTRVFERHLSNTHLNMLFSAKVGESDKQSEMHARTVPFLVNSMLCIEAPYSTGDNSIELLPQSLWKEGNRNSTLEHEICKRARTELHSWIAAFFSPPGDQSTRSQMSQFISLRTAI